MKMLKIAYYSALKNFKDIKTHLFIVILPILLIIILGMALDPYHTPQDIKKEDIAYYRSDSGEAAVQFEAFIKDERIAELLNVRFVDDYEEGKMLLNNGSIGSFVYIPEGFSTNLYTGTKAKIQLLSTHQYPVVKTLLENYLHRMNGSLAVYMLGGIPTDESGDSYIHSVPITTDGKVPRALDYYAVQTLLQVLILGALFGITAVQEDKEVNTIVRIKSAPVKISEILVGRTLASIAVLYAQALIVMAFSGIVYQANWGGSPAVNLLVLFIFVVFVIGLGMLMGVLIKNPVVSIAALWGVMFFFAATGGAFGGTINDTLARLSPNHYAATAIFNNVFAGSPEVIRSSVTALVLAAAGVYILTFIIGRRRFA